jgi:thiamine biosynthesis lipoprotein
MNVRAWVVSGFLFLSICSCAASAPRRGGAGARFEYTQVHMGMPVRLVLYAADESAAREAAIAGFARIAALDAMLSDYRADSELRRLEVRAARHWVPVSPDLLTVLTRALDVANRTGGAFDPTVRPLVALWRRARAERRLPAPAALQAARQLVGWGGVRLDPARRAVRFAHDGIQLDLGGIAKGYVAQAALGTLREHGVASALVEAGGDIAVSDAPPGRAGWTVAAPGASPAFADRASRLANAALATSGPSAQFVEIDGVRYSHVIDPRTGSAVTSPTFARVISRDAMTADALATALTVLDRADRRDVLERFPGVLTSMHPESTSASDRLSPQGFARRSAVSAPR